MSMVEITEERTIKVRRHPTFILDGEPILTSEQASVAAWEFLSMTGSPMPEKVEVKEVTPDGDGWKVHTVLTHYAWSVVATEIPKKKPVEGERDA